MQTSSPRILTTFHPFIPLALNPNKEAATAPARIIPRFPWKKSFCLYRKIPQKFPKKGDKCNFPG